MKSLFREVAFTRPHARLAILFTSLMAALIGIMGPFFQKEFIDRITGHTSYASYLNSANPLTLILSAFFCVLISQALSQLTTFLAVKESLYMQRVFAKKLYEKTLHLRVDTMSGKPIGEIVSLYATDVPGATVFLDQTLPAGCSTLFPLILAPFSMSLLFDIPLWPTIGVMMVITFFNTIMAFRQSNFFYLFKNLAAERIGLVNEWIQNIRTIRILGWIRHFERNIFNWQVALQENKNTSL
jgi:ABC-type bacteriocin/lantibiotic exporter with double-glycine peptidase domain